MTGMRIIQLPLLSAWQILL